MFRFDFFAKSLTQKEIEKQANFLMKAIEKEYMNYRKFEAMKTVSFAANSIPVASTSKPLPTFNGLGIFSKAGPAGPSVSGTRPDPFQPIPSGSGIVNRGIFGIPAVRFANHHSDDIDQESDDSDLEFLGEVELDDHVNSKMNIDQESDDSDIEFVGETEYDQHVGNNMNNGTDPTDQLAKTINFD